MPISGPTASQQIQYAYKAAQAALEEARAAAASTNNSLRSISDGQRDTLGDLAAHYLPELSREAVDGTWDEVRLAIEKVLLRQEDEVARLNTILMSLQTQRDEADRWADQSNEQLDDLLDQQTRLSEQLSRELVENEGFRQLTQRAAEAEAALQRAENSLVEIEHEASQKLPAYDQSRLFKYLYDRGLGSQSYEHKGLTRRMDRWVGTLINYNQAKLSYEYLRDTPTRVRELVSKDREALNVVMAELEKQRDQAAERLGIPAVVAAVAAADADHQKALEQLAAIEQQLATARQDLADSSNPTGRYYREAIEHFRVVLAKSGTDQLANRARNTPDPRDDQIVARLEHLDLQFRGANTEAVARQQRIEWLDRYLVDLSQFHHRFRATGLDSSRSMFDDSLNLAYDLEMVREGRDTMENVWVRMKQCQRFAPTGYETTGDTLSRVASHPMTHVLVNAMAAAATQAMTNHARQAGRRYGQGRHGRR